MKRTLIFTLIITMVALLCSCNLDAQDGILASIASSTKESSIKIKSYLGYYNGHHYILTDTAITQINGTSSFKEITNTDNFAVEAALLLSDGTILVHRHDAKVYKYNADGTEVGELKEGLTCKKLLTNGKILGTYNGKLGLYDSDGTALVDEISEFKTIRESGQYTLIETTVDTALTSPNKIYIYKNSGTPVASVDAVINNTIGFEAISATEFYILKNNDTLYKISVDTTGTATIKSFSNISYTFAADKAASFHYTDEGITYLVFKASENFVRIKLSTQDVDTVSSGYGSLKQNEVANILQDTSDPDKFIIATYANSIWKIDPTSTADPVDLL